MANRTGRKISAQRIYITLTVSGFTGFMCLVSGSRENAVTMKIVPGDSAMNKETKIEQVYVKMNIN